ncbi:MAG: response regulator transcription factor, partial [Bacteroidota bacterium]
EHHPDTFRTYWQMGLRGYLLGYTSKSELLLCIHSVAEGGWYYPPILRTELLANQDGPHSLTIREREVLLFLASGRTTREIAVELAISEQTILTYRKRLQQKLDAANVAHLISRAFHEGYLQREWIEH